MKEEIEKRIAELKVQNSSNYFTGSIQSDMDHEMKINKLVELLWLFTDNK